MSKWFEGFRFEAAVFSALTLVAVFAGLTLSIAGCQEPDQILNGAPPGVDPRSLQKVQEDPSEALGEQASSSGPVPKAQTIPDLVPALPTAKGETKTTPSNVKYETLQEGTGAVAKAGQRVKVHYTGTLEDGRKFDSSRDRGDAASFSIGTGGVIRGWDEAVPGMKIGERRKLTVPPAAGYGAQGRPPSIPANATLIFDIELIDVQ